MKGQMNIFDFISQTEDDGFKVGEYIKHHGRIISPADFPDTVFIGSKIVLDKSTESHEWYQVVEVLDGFAKLNHTDGTWRIICNNGTIHNDLVDINERQIHDNQMLHSSRWVRAYLLPDHQKSGDSILGDYPGAMVRFCPMCHMEMYRMVKNPGGKSYVTLDIHNCRRCGFIRER